MAESAIALNAATSSLNAVGAAVGGVGLVGVALGIGAFLGVPIISELKDIAVRFGKSATGGPRVAGGGEGTGSSEWWDDVWERSPLGWVFGERPGGEK